MKSIVFSIFLIAVVISIYLSSFGEVFAQEEVSVAPASSQQIDYTLPYPGIIPDHPLYFIKKLRDKILLFLTRDPVRKNEIYLLISDKKVVMGQLLYDKKKYELSADIFLEAEEDLLKVSKGIVELKTLNNLPEGLADKVELAAKKHSEVINSIIKSLDMDEYNNLLQDALDINQQAIEQLLTVK